MGDPSVLYILTGAVAIWAAGATAVTFAERPAFLKAIAAIPIAAALICMAALGRLPYMEHRFLIDAGMLGAPIVAAVINRLILHRGPRRRPPPR